jgi:hypothetical protein
MSRRSSQNYKSLVAQVSLPGRGRGGAVLILLR